MINQQQQRQHQQVHHRGEEADEYQGRGDGPLTTFGEVGARYELDHFNQVRDDGNCSQDGDDGNFDYHVNPFQSVNVGMGKGNSLYPEEDFSRLTSSKRLVEINRCEELFRLFHRFESIH